MHGIGDLIPLENVDARRQMERDDERSFEFNRILRRLVGQRMGNDVVTDCYCVAPSFRTMTTGKHNLNIGFKDEAEISLEIDGCPTLQVDAANALRQLAARLVNVAEALEGS
jgi:hypothetical protein